MAFGTLVQYLKQVESAISNNEGDLLAALVSFQHLHIHNQKLWVDFEGQCQKFLENPYDEMIAAHIRCAMAVSNGDMMEAYACQGVVTQSFLKAFQAQKEENWAIPVLKRVVSDLRQFALKAEASLVRSKSRRKPGEMLEKAADLIMSCFRVCVSDSRTALEVSKRVGTPTLVNQLFKIYFKINTLHLCKPLVRAIDGSDIKDHFTKAQFVTYKYFVGKKDMFDSDFKAAAESLEFAFNCCYISSQRNKRLILIYLIPVKMLLGYMPKPELLKKYDLLEFEDVRRAVSQGNLLLLSQTLRKHEAFFIRFGIYLILQKLKIISYRNLFKKVYVLLGGTHQLPLRAFEDALKFMRVEDIDIDEVQCIVANLIDKNYIRGYISHQHQKVVVSKQVPFPSAATILK